jgi:alpha-amylase
MASAIKALNGTFMQYFHWYVPNDGHLWTDLQKNASELAQAGFTALWIPPAYKGSGGSDDVGYGVYDLFDLGEFDQKGSVRTKYGTKEQLTAAVQAAHAAGLQIYADTVFNQRNGGDETEVIRAIPFSDADRIGAAGSVVEIESYTKFNFAGRGDRYSSMKWNHYQFDSVNHNMRRPGDNTVYLFEGQTFEKFCDLEKGNYDFLMGCDLDMDNEQVQGELKYWGDWFLDTVGVDGFRIDAVKHMPVWFIAQWVEHVRAHAKRPLFCVGEYWSNNLPSLEWYLREAKGQLSLFDVPLHQNFHQASRQGKDYDMRRIFDGTLTQQQPLLSVPFVENHDTQPGQALESPVEPWFKPLAYALILLRESGYPCVFYADYYGAEYPNGGGTAKLYSHRFLIDRFLKARKSYAYGPQHDYFDHPDTVGWTRSGDADHPKAMAVVLTNGEAGYKWMDVGRKNAKFVDLTEHCKTPIYSNADGWGKFTCPGGSVSVWVQA